MKQALCPICERAVDQDLLEYHLQTEENLLDQIVKQYPAWKNSPEKIVSYYRLVILPRQEEKKKGAKK